MTKKYYSEEEKKKYLEEFKQGNLTFYEFIAETSIPEETFERWLREENETEFGAIELNQHLNRRISKAYKTTQTFVSEKIKIELVEGFNKEFLMKIVEVMCYAE